MTNRHDAPTPVSFELFNFDGVEDARLVMGAIGRLVMGLQPLTQWAPVFSNPDLMDRPGLRSKAFTVWFPTTLDFLGQSVPELDQHKDELARRGLDGHALFEITQEVTELIRALLSLFHKEEQLYLNDRRLQNVHGLVSQFFRPDVGVKWYRAEDQLVVREIMDDETYHEIMRTFYPTMQESTIGLLDRCVTSTEWASLGELAHGAGSIENLSTLADGMGVGTTPD